MEEENPETLECSKCGLNVEQILALQCDHNLCLQCASKTALGHCSRGENLNYIKCEICGVNTILDPNSIEILSELKEQYLLQTIGDQQSKSGYNNQSQHNIQSYHQSQDNVQFGTFEGSQEELMTDNNSNQFSQQQRTGLVACRDHPMEEAILYCFTCETPCICVECCLQGLHKGHDLKNVMKNYDALTPSIEDLRFKIKTRTEQLINDESRLTSKKRDIIELVNTSKQNIKQSFQDLFEIVEQKQNELLQNCEEQVQEKFSLIDRNINEIKEYTTYLGQFDANLSELFYQNSSKRNFQPQNLQERQVKAYNFYADNKLKICQQLKDMDINFFTNIQAQLQIDYSMDMQSLYQYLDSIREIKLEITTLRGVESSMPSQYEQINYEKLLQDRNKSKFSTFGKCQNDSQLRNIMQGQSPVRLRDVTSEKISDHINQSNISYQLPSNNVDYKKNYELKIKNKLEQKSLRKNLESERSTQQRIQELKQLM